MGKETGLGVTTLSVDNSAGALQSIVNDFTNFSFSTPRADQDVTGVDKAARERLLLLGDAAVNLAGVFNPAANRAHQVFRDVVSTSVQRTVSFAHLSQLWSGEFLFTDYAVTRGNGGELTYTAPGVLANGVAPVWS